MNYLKSIYRPHTRQVSIAALSGPNTATCSTLGIAHGIIVVMSLAKMLSHSKTNSPRVFYKQPEACPSRLVRAPLFGRALVWARSQFNLHIHNPVSIC